MIVFMVAVIVLCAIYEMFKNREIAEARESEIAA